MGIVPWFVFVLILKQDISLSFANEACLAGKQDRRDAKLPQPS